MKLFKYLFLIELIAQPAILISNIVNNTTNKIRNLSFLTL
ncbi:hypothetical protein AB668_05535 [Mycoplasma sp. HU2014]|nr:hypothetical protein AB668_05535 [Mycoplasma sp. HU2014]